MTRPQNRVHSNWLTFWTQGGIASHRLARELVTGHTDIETHAIYRNIDLIGARKIAEALDALHQGREQVGKTNKLEKILARSAARS